jgi:hypothetical protein
MLLWNSICTKQHKNKKQATLCIQLKRKNEGDEQAISALLNKNTK